MSVTLQSTVTTHTASGSTATFAYSFRILAAADLVVEVNGAALTLDVDYTVSGVGATNGGNVVLTGGAPPAGVTVRLRRATRLVRVTDYQTAGDFLAAVVNADFDKAMMALQDLFNGSSGPGNAVRAPAGEALGELPAAAQRAGMQLLFDGDGAPYLAAPVSGSAADVMLQFASSAAGKGAALVGYSGALAYTAGTVGAALVAQAATQAAQAASITALQARDIDAMQALVADLAAGTPAAVACFGDSTMWGADPADLASQVAVPPPAAMANLVNNWLGAATLTVANSALSGTTATQMIAGTDGSGQTFAARIAASPARVVMCNHGINDAFGGSATTLAAYRTALLQFVAITRAAGKTPVLVTPFPCLTLGGFGSQARAEATARFAQAMRDIAASQGVTLVDNHRTISRLMQIDGQLPLSLMPDGVHGSQGLYGFAGNQLAGAILGSMAPSLSRSGQRLPASGPAIRATSQTMNASTTSRVGCVVTTGSGGTQSLRMVFRVDEPGLDLVLGHPVFSSGSGAIDVNLSGASLGTLSQAAAGFGSSFWQDFETVIARGLAPGFHLLILSCSGGGGIGLNYLRSRSAERPLMLPSGSAVPSQRALLLEYKLDLSSSVADTLCVFDDLPASRFLDDLELEWSGQMLKSSAVVIGGNVGSNAGAAAAERAVSIGLDSAGKLAVWEATAPGTYTLTTVGAADLSGASHLYRVQITTAGAVTLFVDDVQIGTATLTGPYRGGLLGLWKLQAGGTLTVTDLCRVWRL